LSTLYIRLPSKAAADHAPHWTALACPFAWVSNGDAIEREGVEPLSDMAAMAAKAQRVVLLLAASDVTVLRVQVPPLSPAKLRAALPNLVEDQLISDPAESAVVAGVATDGLRTVAVVNRGWLEILIKTLHTLGARHLMALPAQLCLPYQEGVVSAAVTEQGGDVDVTLRLAEQDGIGLPMASESPESEAQEVVQTICALVPEAPITLYVPQAAASTYQATVNDMLALDQRVTVYADNWSRWIAGVRQAGIDLMLGVGAATPTINWRAWRWPVALAVAVLVINIIGLNVDWLRMRREADGLRVAMIQTYRNAYPKDPVVIDPIAQIRQKIAAAKHDAGQTAPDDFTALAANFGEAWDRAMQQSNTKPSAALAGVEYRDRSLFVRLKAGNTMPVEAIKTALAVRNLSMSETGNGVWQIRSTK
jgi:general secretion pathway protein L